MTAEARRSDAGTLRELRHLKEVIECHEYMMYKKRIKHLLI